MEVVKEEGAKTPEKIKYDPNLSYGWNPNDIFYLNGQEFGAVINMLREAAANPLIHAVINSAKVMEGVLIRSVESGISKPVATPTPEVLKEEKPKISGKKTVK